MARDIEQCNTSLDTVVRTPSGVKAVEHVRVEPPSGKPVVPVPEHCIVPKRKGGTEGEARTVFYEDDAMSLEVRNVERCIALSQSLVSIHHVILTGGERGG